MISEVPGIRHRKHRSMEVHYAQKTQVHGSSLGTENAGPWKFIDFISHVSLLCSFQTFSVPQLIIEDHKELIIFPQKHNLVVAILFNMTSDVFHCRVMTFRNSRVLFFVCL